MFASESGRKEGFGASGGEAKKINIKPFKTKPKVPETLEADHWKVLQESLRSLFDNKPISKSKEQLYRTVEELCIHKLSENLYSNLIGECREFIENNVLNTLSPAHRPYSSDFRGHLQALELMWKTHCDRIFVAKNIFLYLDRTYAMAAGGSGSGSGSLATHFNPSTANPSTLCGIWSKSLIILCQVLRKDLSSISTREGLAVAPDAAPGSNEIGKIVSSVIDALHAFL